MRRGRKSAAQTPAPKSERIYGSKKNPKGSASSKKTAKNISFSEKTIKSLDKKLKEFKKNRPNSKITLNDLKAVYRRGAGAYSSSHRPTITGGVPNSRNAWAMARVNKFLKKAAGEKVKAAYVQDDDLLENGGITGEQPNFKKAYSGGYLEKIWKLLDEKYNIDEEDFFRTEISVNGEVLEIYISRNYYKGKYGSMGYLKSYSLNVNKDNSVILNTDKISKLTKKQSDILNQIINELDSKIVCFDCGWEWKESKTQPEDKYVCHKCGVNNAKFYNPKEIPFENQSEQGQDISINEGNTNIIAEKMARGKKIVGGGDCYYVAGQFAMAENFSPLAPADIDFIGTPYVVHAEVKGQGPLEGIRYGHAWVEDDENVYDYSNKRELIIPKNLYYSIGDIEIDNPKKYRKYTFQEARRKMVENRHYGQWDIEVDYKKGGEVCSDKGLQEIIFMESGGMATDYNYKYNQFLMKNEEILDKLENGGNLKTPKSFQEIQEMHGTNPDYLLEQLMKGISVEREHTDSDEMAQTIALHHLEERPDYYEILEKVEKGEQMVPEMEFENNYYLWIVDEMKQGEGYDFANIEEAVKSADITKYPNKMMSVRNYCGQKLIGHEDIMMINSGSKQLTDVMLKKGGEIPEIEEFLRNQKEEADAVLFSRKSKIMKYMICNSNIEYAEEQIDMTENDLEKNVWQQTKMIWSETKEEVDDMIFMYGEGGQPHTCSCQKYSKGGLAYGNSHDKGGMPMTVKSTGQKIEIEGGEGVVNKRTMQSAKEVNLNGKKMTPCEAVSKLNEMGGGVKFKCPDVKEIISKDGNF